MKTKYLVVTPNSQKEFSDLGNATRHYSILAKIFPRVTLYERNFTAYRTYSRVVLSQDGFNL